MIPEDSKPFYSFLNDVCEKTSLMILIELVNLRVGCRCCFFEFIWYRNLVYIYYGYLKNRGSVHIEVIEDFR